VLQTRQELRWGPHRLAAFLGLPQSTCSKVLSRNHFPRLAWLDRPTGQLVRRYEMTAPGDLGHMDVKKLARIPDGGGHFVHGRKGRPRRDYEKGVRIGYGFVHSLVDDHSRVAYSEVLDDETAATVGQFFRRALASFAAYGVRFKAVMTDNAWAYRNGNDYHQALAEIGARAVFIPPYTPRINGKVERFNRTLLDEWAYRKYTSERERTAFLKDWLHLYNFHRHHTAVGAPPISRLNNVCGNYTERGDFGKGGPPPFAPVYSQRVRIWVRTSKGSSPRWSSTIASARGSLSKSGSPALTWRFQAAAKRSARCRLVARVAGMAW
jgi:Integrase core domain